MKMLADGWIPDSSEGQNIGLVSHIVVDNGSLLDAADDAARRFLFHNHERSFSTLVSGSEVC